MTDSTDDSDEESQAETDVGEPTVDESTRRDPTEPAYELRETAPQQPYSMRQVGVGLVVLLVGLAIAYALPLFS